MSISSTIKTIGQARIAAFNTVVAVQERVDTWSTERSPFVHSVAQQIEANGFTNAGRVCRFATRGSRYPSQQEIFGVYCAPQIGGGKRKAPVTARKGAKQNAQEKKERKRLAGEEVSTSSEEESSSESEAEPEVVVFSGKNVDTFVQGKAAKKAEDKQQQKLTKFFTSSQQTVAEVEEEKESLVSGDIEGLPEGVTVRHSKLSKADPNFAQAIATYAWEMREIDPATRWSEIENNLGYVIKDIGDSKAKTVRHSLKRTMTRLHEEHKAATHMEVKQIKELKDENVAPTGVAKIILSDQIKLFQVAVSKHLDQCTEFYQESFPTVPCYICMKDVNPLVFRYGPCQWYSSENLNAIMQLCNFATGALPAEEQKLIFIEYLSFYEKDGIVDRYVKMGRTSFPKLLAGRGYSPVCELEFIATKFNTGNEHWIAAVADLKQAKLYLVDSFGNETYRQNKVDTQIAAFQNYIVGAGFPRCEYTTQQHRIVQPDGHSCGPFVTEYFLRCASKQKCQPKFHNFDFSEEGVIKTRASHQIAATELMLPPFLGKIAAICLVNQYKPADEGLPGDGKRVPDQWRTLEQIIIDDDSDVEMVEEGQVQQEQEQQDPDDIESVIPNDDEEEDRNMPADHEEQEHRPISERGPMLLSEQALHGIATSQSLEHAAMRLIIEEGRVKDPKYYSEWQAEADRVGMRIEVMAIFQRRNMQKRGEDVMSPEVREAHDMNIMQRQPEAYKEFIKRQKMSSMTNLGPLHKSAEVSEDEGLCSNSSGKTIICPVNCQCDLHYLSKEEVKEEEYDAVEQPIGQVEMEERQPEVVPVAEPVLEVQPMVLQQEVVPQVVPVAEPVLQVQQVVAQQEVVQQQVVAELDGRPEYMKVNQRLLALQNQVDDLKDKRAKDKKKYKKAFEAVASDMEEVKKGHQYLQNKQKDAGDKMNEVIARVDKNDALIHDVYDELTVQAMEQKKALGHLEETIEAVHKKVLTLEDRMVGIEEDVKQLVEQCHGHGVDIASLTNTQQNQILLAAQRQSRLNAMLKNMALMAQQQF